MKRTFQKWCKAVPVARFTNLIFLCYIPRLPPSIFQFFSSTLFKYLSIQIHFLLQRLSFRCSLSMCSLSSHAFFLSLSRPSFLSPFLFFCSNSLIFAMEPASTNKTLRKMFCDMHAHAVSRPLRAQSPKPKSRGTRGSDSFRSWVRYRAGRQSRSPRNSQWTWVPGAYSYRWQEGGDGPDPQKMVPQSS